MIPKEMDTFFTDLSEYMRFYLTLKELHKQAQDKSCYASLKKEDGKYLYTLAWHDGRWVGDYVKPFRVNEENLRIFHAGCKEVSRRLQIYLDTDDPNQVPQSPPTFGALSWESLEYLESNAPLTKSPPSEHKYFPRVQEARTVSQYEGGEYDISLPSDIQPPRISSKESPREILAADFKSLGELPIRGGWGYTIEDAVIIDKNDSVVPKSVPFNGVGIEYIFVEKRIYEEMIIFRPDGEKFSGIKWKPKEQNLLHQAGRSFDRLVFEITAFRDNDWEELKDEFEGPQGYGTLDFDEEAHERKRQEKMVRFDREFWFDITSFYGQGLVITDKSTGKKELLPPESFKFTDKFKKLFGID